MNTKLQIDGSTLNRVALAYAAQHGLLEWKQCYYDGACLVVPNSLLAKVQAVIAAN